MALKDNFYEEIHKKEKIWIELIEKNILNTYYLNKELEPFYKKKLEELTYEYNLTNNQMIGHVIEEIKSIVQKLEELNTMYRDGNNVNIKQLIPLFLVNRFNNNIKAETKENINLQKEVLKNVKKILKPEDDDYLYDDFPENKKAI